LWTGSLHGTKPLSLEHMGLLALGTALEWEDAKKQAGLVREWGIRQLLEIWNKAKTKERDALLWGDEVHGKPILFLKWHDILTGIRRWNTSWLSTARTTRRWLSR
jgi:hypothetical protein